MTPRDRADGVTHPSTVRLALLCWVAPAVVAFAGSFAMSALLRALSPDNAVAVLFGLTAAYAMLAWLIRFALGRRFDARSVAAFVLGASIAGVVLFRADAAEVGTIGAALEGIAIYGTTALVGTLLAIVIRR